MQLGNLGDNNCSSYHIATRRECSSITSAEDRGIDLLFINIMALSNDLVLNLRSNKKKEGPI